MGIEPHPLTIYKSPSGTDTFAVFLDIDSFVDTRVSCIASWPS